MKEKQQSPLKFAVFVVKLGVYDQPFKKALEENFYRNFKKWKPYGPVWGLTSSSRIENNVGILVTISV